MPVHKERRTRGFGAVFRSKNFLYYSISDSFSQLSDKMSHRALLFLIGVMTLNSPTAFSHLAIALTLPVLLFAPLAGIYVDSRDRKKVLVAANSVRGLLLLSLAVFGYLSWPLISIYLIVFLSALAGLFQNTAKLSMLPNIVKPSELLAGNSAMSMLGRGASILGFLAADLLVSWDGLDGSGFSGGRIGFLTAGIFFLAAALLASRIVLTFKRAGLKDEAKSGRRPLKAAAEAVSIQFKQGVELIRRHRLVRTVLGSAFAITGVAAAVYVIGIPIIQEELTSGILGLGALGAALGIGWFSGSILIGTMGNRIRKGTLLFAGFFLIGGILLVNPFIRTFAAAAAAALLGGMALAAVFITLNTLLHEHLPEELRGRIFGIREWVNNGSFLLGAGLFGLLARSIEPRHLLLGLGAAVLLPAAGALLHRRFRRSLGIDYQTPP